MNDAKCEFNTDHQCKIILTLYHMTNIIPVPFTGTIIGLCASVNALMRTIAPTIGGLLFEMYNVPSFGLLQCGVNIIVVVYLLQYGLKKQETKDKAL